MFKLLVSNKFSALLDVALTFLWIRFWLTDLENEHWYWLAADTAMIVLSVIDVYRYLQDRYYARMFSKLEDENNDKKD